MVSAFLKTKPVKLPKTRKYWKKWTNPKSKLNTEQVGQITKTVANRGRKCHKPCSQEFMACNRTRDLARRADRTWPHLSYNVRQKFTRHFTEQSKYPSPPPPPRLKQSRNNNNKLRLVFVWSTQSRYSYLRGVRHSSLSLSFYLGCRKAWEQGLLKQVTE